MIFTMYGMATEKKQETEPFIGEPLPAERDSIWVEASRRGDVAAFNRLVLQWERTIYNLTLRMVRNPEQAADLTQEIFLSAFRHIKNFEGRSRFSTWLYRIAMNRCLTHLGRSSSAGMASLEEKFSIRCRQEHLSTESHEDQVIRSEDGKRAVTAMLQLPLEWRVVLELKFLQELTFGEIGEVLNLPVSSVKSRVYAGLQALQEKLR